MQAAQAALEASQQAQQAAEGELQALRHESERRAKQFKEAVRAAAARELGSWQEVEAELRQQLVEVRQQPGRLCIPGVCLWHQALAGPCHAART
jgi:hypothetical protein